MNKAQIIVMWIGIVLLVGYSYLAISSYHNYERVGTLIEVLSIQMIIVTITIGIILQIGYLGKKKDDK
ncbi:MAG: hypothetical protein ACYST6_15645 [Planctomycetota bacterium]|jgi:hypothetical protein